MSWLIWRQHRFEVLLVAIAVGLCATFLAFEHLALASSYAEHGISQCTSADSLTCQSSLQGFANQFGNLDVEIYWMLLLPAMVGIFIGAPLVARELESGTFRFVWVQSVTRTQWFVAKVAALGLVCVAAAAGLSTVISWALDPLIRVDGILLQSNLNALTTPLFDLSGTALIASTLLALSFGTLAGTLTRRTVVAMLLTLVLFAAVRVPLDMFRSHLTAPLTATALVQDSSKMPAIPPGSWVLETGFLDAHGQSYQMIGEASAPCMSHANDAVALKQCLSDIGLRTYAEYQPPDRFWLFQAVESASYLVISFMALVAAWWIIRRRIA